MKVLRALALRADLPRAPVLEETEAADLSTFQQRDAGALEPDALHIAPPKSYWTPLEGPIPGRLVSGTLPPEHRARFILRLPRKWNGKLVLAASSGITDERTYDLYFGDYLLKNGYAFGVTDKGVRRVVFDGDTLLLPLAPDASIANWYSRLEQLSIVAFEAAQRCYARKPQRTYVVGLSNGGFVARKAAESGYPVFSGALDVSGVLWRADKGNLLRQLPIALRATEKEPWDRATLASVGFPAGDARWRPVIAQYKDVYWEAVMRMFTGDLDPEYGGPMDSYDLDARPAIVRQKIKAFENSGDLRIPLISVAGRRDYLISCTGHAEAYRELVRASGKLRLHRLHLFNDSAHVDANCEQFTFAEPLMPQALKAFEELVQWVENPQAPAAPAAKPASP